MPKKPKRKTRGYIYEVREYVKNQAKWKAAEEYCIDRGFEFVKNFILKLWKRDLLKSNTF